MKTPLKNPNQSKILFNHHPETLQQSTKARRLSRLRISSVLSNNWTDLWLETRFENKWRKCKKKLSYKNILSHFKIICQKKVPKSSWKKTTNDWFDLMTYVFIIHTNLKMLLKYPNHFSFVFIDDIFLPNNLHNLWANLFPILREHYNRPCLHSKALNLVPTRSTISVSRTIAFKSVNPLSSDSVPSFSRSLSTNCVHAFEEKDRSTSLLWFRFSCSLVWSVSSFSSFLGNMLFCWFHKSYFILDT